MAARQEADLTELKKAHPECVFVHCELKPSATLKMDALKQKKFIVPRKMTASAFMLEIRKKMDSEQTDARSQTLFLLVGHSNTCLKTTSSMGDVYDRHCRQGIVHVSIATENTLG
mmetsp:Transcript_29079/g.52993  ORF Transcript_29079/g.52993 Transcript_29079/m.52993 type:complete len:115 (-) Transcript_29079:106-450(-)